MVFAVEVVLGILFTTETAFAVWVSVWPGSLLGYSIFIPEELFCFDSLPNSNDPKPTKITTKTIKISFPFSLPIQLVIFGLIFSMISAILSMLFLL